MKSKVLLLIGTLLCLYLETARAGDEVPTDLGLTQEVQGLTNRFVRLTSKPLLLPALYSSLCVPSDDLPHSPHDNHYIHVYISTNAVKSARMVPRSYPVGTVVLKEKMTASKSKQPELYTGMLKREKGYNPNAGDWEFFTVSGDAKRITARGKIDSCIDCHKNYQKTDYLTEIWKRDVEK